METLVLVLSILACFLSVCAFVAAAVTAVIVIGWSKSTHKIFQVPVEPTRFGYDLPPEVSGTDDDSDLTPEQRDYVRSVREAALSDDDE